MLKVKVSEWLSEWVNDDMIFLTENIWFAGSTFQSTNISWNVDLVFTLFEAESSWGHSEGQSIRGSAGGEWLAALKPNIIADHWWIMTLKTWSNFRLRTLKFLVSDSYCRQKGGLRGGRWCSWTGTGRGSMWSSSTSLVNSQRSGRRGEGEMGPAGLKFGFIHIWHRWQTFKGGMAQIYVFVMWWHIVKIIDFE